MHRTTIFLDDALLRRARQLARRQGKSLAAVVRESLAAYLSQGAARRTRLPSIASSFASGHADTSERTDQLLWPDPHV